MHVVETILFVCAFIGESTAAGLILIDISVHRKQEAEISKNPSPISSVLDRFQSIPTMFDKVALRSDEIEMSKMNATTIRRSISRQSWAFVAVATGAIAALIGDLLTVWAH
jgi:hypothetical protein